MRRRPELNPTLAVSRLPSNPLIGSDGAHLFAQMREAREFFDLLRGTLDAPTLEAMAGIFDDYFAGARANADVGESLELTSSEPATVPIALAVDALAELTGTNRERLWATVLAELDPGPGEDLDWHPSAQPFEPATDGERLALACALFLAAWEHLRFVRGTAARGLLMDARLVLDGHWAARSGWRRPRAG